MDQADWPPSSLLQYLPAIYQNPEEPFLGRFLLAFEKLMFGRNDGVVLPTTGDEPPALERTIANIASYFVPKATNDHPQTPDDFVPWLASWTAFTLRFDLQEQQRDFIQRVISLYRTRGTKQNLVDLLRIFTRGTPSVEDIGSGSCTAGFIADTRGSGTGTTLTVGGTVTGTWVPGQMVSGGTTAADTYVMRQIDGDPGGAGTYEVSVSQTVATASLAGNFGVHRFSVKVSLRGTTSTETQRQIEITRALVELGKPAHAQCHLLWDFPSMQIGIRSHIGVDTLLGTRQAAGGPG
jgi:hypothetical protein